MSETGWSTSIETSWAIARPDPESARSLAESVGTSPLVAQVLLNRGIDNEDQARKFLRPTLTDLEDPGCLPDADAAAKQIVSAIRENVPIVVFGDYDVDGISGTALLVSFLQLLGASARGVLPNRLKDGYGLNLAAVQHLAEEGVGLLVTVDHGTSAVQEIRAARDAGLDVVVIDHHTPGEVLPPANALVNPMLADGEGPYPCGVGVAFKMAWAVARELAGGPRVARVHREFLLDALSLVALGTVADVVPLRGENRILAAIGLERLGASSRPGLRALINASRIAGDRPTAGDVGFRLAPRINAGGRMGKADLALELLLTDSPSRAGEIAQALDRENRRRREIERGIFEAACGRVEEEYAPGHLGALVLGSDDWHPGVIGIVASRLVDRYHRPVALAAFDGDLGRGSCRTIPAIHLHDSLASCSGHLETFGGHARAAGFSVRKERFEGFRVALDDVVRSTLVPEDLVRSLRVDVASPLSAVTPACVKDLERLAPFGEGNPRPVFATRRLRVAGRARRLGKQGEHLSFLATDGTTTLKTIGFRMGDRAGAVDNASSGVDIAYTPGFDTWRNDGSLELGLKDVAPSDG